MNRLAVISIIIVTAAPVATAFDGLFLGAITLLTGIALNAIAFIWRSPS